MNEKLNVYVGSYSRDVLFGDGSVMHGKGDGISRFILETETGGMTADFALDTENPSYLILNKERTMIYSVNELEEYDGMETGCVSSFRMTESGFVFVNRKITRGLDPCHVALTPDEKYLCAANYTSGSFCVFQILEDGSIGDEVQFVQQEGRGKDDSRQEGPHCHSTVFSPDGRFAYVQNLGTDEIYCYQYLPNLREPFVPAECGIVQSDPGDGPRFLCFDREGRYACSVNELSNSISVFRWKRESGELDFVQKVSSLAEDRQSVKNLFADLHFSADGRYLYASNRGDDSIVIFDIDQESGRLHIRKRVPCEGSTPRNFAIDSTGKFLLCANQDSDNIVIFSIDQESGDLTKVNEVRAGSPVCIQISG